MLFATVKCRCSTASDIGHCPLGYRDGVTKGFHQRIRHRRDNRPNRRSQPHHQAIEVLIAGSLSRRNPQYIAFTDGRWRSRRDLSIPRLARFHECLLHDIDAGQAAAGTWANLGAFVAEVALQIGIWRCTDIVNC